VEVLLEGGPKDTLGARPLAVALAPEAEAPGYFSALVTAAGAGTLYRYRLDGGPALYPDPVSRFQPSGPHGPSQVIDPGTFQWTDAAWPGVPLEGQVIYEMHLGTFTPEGT
jgi:maltooligosyltrehalose trehalohydrolase